MAIRTTERISRRSNVRSSDQRTGRHGSLRADRFFLLSLRDPPTRTSQDVVYRSMDSLCSGRWEVVCSDSSVRCRHIHEACEVTL